jgi:hypothetical protein
VGPCLLYDTLTAQRCRGFLKSVKPRLLENVPLALRQNLWFQHDGAPAQYGTTTRSGRIQHIQEGGVELEG